MKGFLNCNNIYYENEHVLPALLENIEAVYKPTDECEKSIVFLSRYKSGLRYKSMKDDPTPEDARLAISYVKRVMEEFRTNPKVMHFMDEAREVYEKTLLANSEKYADKDISKDTLEK